jgi:hypothetical protein
MTKKLVLMSIMIATIAIPAVAARDPHPLRGLKRVVVYALIFDLIYAFAFLVLYPRV